MPETVHVSEWLVALNKIEDASRRAVLVIRDLTPEQIQAIMAHVGRIAREYDAERDSLGRQRWNRKRRRR